MKISQQKHRYSPHLSRKKMQIVLYLGMLGIFMAVFLPISTLLSPTGGLFLSFLLVAALVGWMQWRISKLQARVYKAEQQLRRLSSQKSTVTIQSQSVSHLEAENFFGHDQTRH